MSIPDCVTEVNKDTFWTLIDQHNDIWDLTSPEIQATRRTAPKSKKVQNRGESR